MATNKTVINISFKENPEFNGKVRAVVFDSAGNLLAEENIKKGKATIPLSEKVISRSRVFISPIVDGDEDDKTASLTSMERLKAFEIVAPRGKFPEKIRIPDMIIGDWIICLCWIRGQVIKSDNGLPVCNAKVHICEVDRLPLILEKLPDPDIFRLREDLLDRFIDPIEIRPPIPEPDPIPFERINIPSHLGRLGGAGRLGHINRMNLNTKHRLKNNLDNVSFNPQPEPPRLKLPLGSLIALESNSVQIVRESLIQNYKIIFPFLCWFRWWNWYRCDELRVITTDANGRFSTVIAYPCNGDKPDLYFWVEYKINNAWESVYKPRIACATYWNYTCGKEVTIRVSDTRVVACDNEPNPSGCVVQVISIGREVSMSEVRDNTVSSTEGLTTDNQPFGGKLELRVWFSRTTLRDDKNIKYYRWSYRRLTEGNGTPLSPLPTIWEPLTRMTVRHYAKPDGTGDITHEPYVLGPKSEGSESNLFEIKPANVPAGGIEWSVVDEREDLASSHFVTTALGNGTNVCDKALDAAGKYELKLELFKDNGNLVNWTTEGIDLRLSDIPAAFGTNTVTTTSALDYNKIKVAGDTMAFRMVLRIDNNCCKAQVETVTGTGLSGITPCGFVEYTPGATVTLQFKALHPNGFADIDFNLIRGVSTEIHTASAAGMAGTSPIFSNDSSHAYNLTGTQDYRETFSVVELLGSCDRAAFAEILHVNAIATNGYGELSHLDANSVAGFALTRPCKNE